MTEPSTQAGSSSMDGTKPHLDGLRILITRPRHQVAAWRQKLQSAGAETLSVPLMAIVPVAQPAQHQAIKNIVLEFDQYQIAIFVSQNAVRYGIEWLRQYWPQLPLGVNFFAVGKATAALLEAECLEVCSAGQAMNSEALLALPQLQDVEGSKVVIFRGCGGRPLLGDRLLARGASVDYCELYLRQLPDEAATQLRGLREEHGFGSEGRDVISVHSGETLENFLAAIDTLAYQEWKELPLLVPGQRVADLATASGFKQIIIAENATDKAMLTALEQWRRQ